MIKILLLVQNSSLGALAEVFIFFLDSKKTKHL